MMHPQEHCIPFAETTDRKNIHTIILLAAPGQHLKQLPKQLANSQTINSVSTSLEILGLEGFYAYARPKT